MNKNGPVAIQKLRHRNISYWSLLTVLIIVMLAAALRIRLLQIPLERDEGGYAYTAQLILQGIPPFEQAYDMKMPGLYYLYVLILLIFGQTTIGIHLGLLVINAATIVLMFFLGRRLLDNVAGLVAAATYAVISLSQHVQGFTANAEQLLLLPALAGILLLFRAIDSGRLKIFFAGGLLMGVALVIKHHGIFFVGFVAICLFVSYSKKPRSRWRRYLLEYAVFLLAVLIPFALLCAVFLAYGLFDKFWFWLFVYPPEYSSVFPRLIGLIFLKFALLKMAQSALLIWILALIGLIVLICRTKKEKQNLSIIFFCLVSFASIIPGYRFYPHYFILALPAVALLAGAGISAVAALLANSKTRLIGYGIPVLLAAAPIIYAVFAEKAYLFELSPNRISRISYFGFPFVESVKIADYIKQHTSPDDSIAILGSEPQICFYAKRRSATSHIYVYPLMGKHKYVSQMQSEMIRQIETARPEFIVFVNMQTSWATQSYSDRSIFKWFEEYRRKYYRLVGVIDIISPEKSIYRWNQDAANYRPLSPPWVSVLKRIK